ncbi:HVO_2922 family protein [Halobellus sp. EA9]|uniref:HVO_2922 family protein n=1 Tax=Halobellus sp. EA9 TaxID=3421647 RepID=UPI003EB9A0F1
MPTNPSFEVYQDNADEWRWRLVVSNGNIIADSGEGYASKQGVKRGIESVRNAVPKATVELQS